MRCAVLADNYEDTILEKEELQKQLNRMISFRQRVKRGAVGEKNDFTQEWLVLSALCYIVNEHKS